MSNFMVFDASVLQHLRLGAWTENSALSGLIAASAATITRDGHLVVWEDLASPSLRTEAFNWLTAACGNEEGGLVSPFLVTIFYHETLYRGSHTYFERFSYSDYNVPDIYGNFADQQCGYTTLTIVSNKRTLDLAFDKWKSIALHASPDRKSAFYVAKSGAAVQVRFFCEEVPIEDVIDFYVVAAFAIREEPTSKMILGQSYTRVESLPTKPYTGKLHLGPTYTLQTNEIQVSVEDQYGPFEKT